jgi:hypothetical protein
MLPNPAFIRHGIEPITHLVKTVTQDIESCCATERSFRLTLFNFAKRCNKHPHGFI